VFGSGVCVALPQPCQVALNTCFPCPLSADKFADRNHAPTCRCSCVAPFGAPISGTACVVRCVCMCLELLLNCGSVGCWCRNACSWCRVQLHLLLALPRWRDLCSPLFPAWECARSAVVSCCCLCLLLQRCCWLQGDRWQRQAGLLLSFACLTLHLPRCLQVPCSRLKSPHSETLSPRELLLTLSRVCCWHCIRTAPNPCALSTLLCLLLTTCVRLQLPETGVTWMRWC